MTVRGSIFRCRLVVSFRLPLTGRWAAAYQSQRNATVPPDLADALAASPPAAQAFEALSKTQQYAVILKLATARTATTRAAQLRKAMTTLHSKPST